MNMQVLYSVSHTCTLCTTLPEQTQVNKWRMVHWEMVRQAGNLQTTYTHSGVNWEHHVHKLVWTPVQGEVLLLDHEERTNMINMPYVCVKEKRLSVTVLWSCCKHFTHFLGSMRSCYLQNHWKTKGRAWIRSSLQVPLCYETASW